MKLRDLLCVAVLVPTASHAATIVVDTTADEDNADATCSLREAVIAAANDAVHGGCVAGDGSDTIVLPAGTFVLTSPLTVGADTVIGGSGPSTSLRPGASPIEVEGAVTLRDLEVRAAQSGAVHSTNAALQLMRVQFVDNAGGAVAVEHDGTAPRPSLRIEQCLVSTSAGQPAVTTNAGDVRIIASAFIDNAAGALAVDGDVSDDVVLSNSTFSGNHAFERGGALAAAVPVAIDSCTFVGNSADIEGGAVFSTTTTAARNSLWFANAAPTAATCALQNSTSLSAGFNLVDNDTDCPFAAAGDVIFVGSRDQLIDNLDDVGGRTPAFLPVATGPAVDAGVCTVDVDQRGARRLDQRCDIGAVEAAGLFVDAVVDVQPATTECLHGGLVVSSGIDDGAGVVADAGDGLLSTAELDAEQIVCTTTDAPILVDVRNGVGACPAGGVIVHTGHDDDGDGVLGIAERERTDVICNGATGAPGVSGPGGVNGVNGQNGQDGQNGGAGASSLLRTTAISSGDDGCEAGGQRIDGGVDDGAGGATANDGILDDGEVDTTAIICNGVSFQDEFATSGGPGCAAGATSPGWFGLLLALRRRRR